jgi:hypothetical protein
LSGIRISYRLRDQAQTGGGGRQRGVAAADDCGTEGMKISPEEARLNIVREYERQHQEGVYALSAAIERRKASNKSAEVNKEATDSAKPELSKLLLESARNDE